MWRQSSSWIVNTPHDGVYLLHRVVRQIQVKVAEDPTEANSPVMSLVLILHPTSTYRSSSKMASSNMIKLNN